MDGKRAVGVAVEGGKEYRAKLGVISNIDAKRVFFADDGAGRGCRS